MIEPEEVGAELDRIWTLLPGAGDRPPLALVEPALTLPSAFPVDLQAVTSVAAATLAAEAVAASRREAAAGAVSSGSSGSSRPARRGGPPVEVEADLALASFTGWLRVDGRPIPVWADLSGRYPTADGRPVQIHANYPHHAAGVAARLGVAEDREAVAAAIARRDAFELEAQLIDDGMICAAYRTLEEWADHPHARATADLPLLDATRLDDAEPRPWPSPGGAGPRTTGGPAGPGLGEPRPLDGIRVLDCTRVLAGPVCGQTLAAHGADVLRVGAAHLPDIEMGVMTTGFGKRNTFVDLRTDDGRRAFAHLVAGADVVVDAYRPGALAGHGFGPDELARLRPGIVVVQLCAFDWTGPWAGRRGYDSIIQTTTGIALAGADAAAGRVGTPAEGAPPGRPGGVDPVHLPVQALDYATGFLAAFAAQRLLAHQRQAGGSWLARLSLLRTRNWLTALGGPAPFTPGPVGDLGPWLHTVESPFGRLEAVRPVAGRWDTPPAPLGSSPATWA